MAKHVIVVALVLATQRVGVLAAAPPPASTLQALSRYESQTVWIADVKGAEWSGWLVEVRSAELVVLVNNQLRTVPVSDIGTVSVQETAAKRGFLVGLGVGVPLVSVAVGMADRPSSVPGKIGAGVVGALTYAAAGAGLGALHRHRVVVFRREPQAAPAAR